MDLKVDGKDGSSGKKFTVVASRGLHVYGDSKEDVLLQSKVFPAGNGRRICEDILV